LSNAVPQPEENRLAVGMTDGLLSIRSRRPKAKAEEEAFKARPRGNTFAFFNRGKGHQAEQVNTTSLECLRLCCVDRIHFINIANRFCLSQGDLKVDAEKKLRLQAYEKFLKKFQYSNALDAALEVS
jgi:hypothetical protein